VEERMGEAVVKLVRFERILLKAKSVYCDSVIFSYHFHSHPLFTFLTPVPDQSDWSVRGFGTPRGVSHCGDSAIGIIRKEAAKSDLAESHSVLPLEGQYLNYFIRVW